MNMGKVVTFLGPKDVGVTDFEDRRIQPNEVRLKTLFSGISAGTELTHYRGSNIYLHKFWNETDRLFVSGDGSTSKTYPIYGSGYEECGQVVELGSAVDKVQVGDIIYGTWQHRTHHIVSQDYAASRRMPPNLDPILGIFSQMTAIAYNGILDAGIRLGETVAVFGLGVPGQMCAQMAKCSGARVIGIDMIPARLELGKDQGWVDIGIDGGQGKVAEKIKELTHHKGADVAFEVSGAYAALHEAIRSVAYSGKVISQGFYQGGGQALCLGEEFHHNRITVICSQISGVSAELSNRWNVERMVRRGIELQAEGVLNFKPLISHKFRLDQVAEAYQLLDEHSDQALQVVIDFT
jgi:2-desacetyl-2-hydroxyethyl bacteriochlorophyllide A dehydrogenase